VPQKAHVERCEDQNDADIHDQAFPKMIPEKQVIHAHYDGGHDYDVHNGNPHSASVLRFIGAGPSAAIAARPA
jgi:hypothetical protein